MHSASNLGMDRVRHKQAVKRMITWVSVGLLFLSHNRLDLPGGLSVAEQLAIFN